jgi:EAL domain-containing protein (putative c-di-GMP-specific phosphodiesterase class I)
LGSVGQTILQVSASIGVTVYPKDAADADQLLRHADQAMYVAKQSGKNCYKLFDLIQDAALKAEQDNLASVRNAMDRREFVLHYQPKVNMKTGAVIGAEALIRWQHPEQGLLLPAAFLPIINNHSYGIELGEWVIDAAFAQLTEWHKQNFYLPVSVNIGAHHLQQDGFVLRLRERFAAHPAIRPDHIDLEILESSALVDMNNAMNIMKACCEIGVHFALDDFGTGYSSLTYLRRLPVNMLKIDQSFVRDMMSDPEDLAIIEGVIGLAKAFHYQVIAEGVETAGHGELLLALGCDLAQGYAIARPMPGTELPWWVDNWLQSPVRMQ